MCTVLLHVHQNVPGVLTAINQVFSQYNINIVGQYLQTKESMGYVVMDINTSYSEEALEQLRNVPGTVRVRVLF